jgi:hypothetical protein
MGWGGVHGRWGGRWGGGESVQLIQIRITELKCFMCEMGVASSCHGDVIVSARVLLWLQCPVARRRPTVAAQWEHWSRCQSRRNSVLDWILWMHQS